MTSQINITISYRVRSQQQLYTISMLPEDYFDYDECDFDIDSVPKYMNPLDYINQRQDVTEIVVEIEDTINEKKLRLVNNYFDNQQSILSFRIEFDKEQTTYEEMIIDMCIPKTANNTLPAHDISRFILTGDQYLCIYHGIIYDNDDGSETEHCITPHRSNCNQ